MTQMGLSKDQPSSQPTILDVKSADQPGVAALRSIKAHLCFWLTAGAGLAVDWASKLWAIKTIGIPPTQEQMIKGEYFYQPIVVIENYLRFATIPNPGALAGLLAGQTTLLVIASLAALVFLLWLFATSRGNQWLTHIALGMLVAGALGNMYDRLFNQGKVIDFIEVNLHVWPANPWPTFNVADILLCIGVGVLLLTLLGSQKHSQKAKAA